MIESVMEGDVGINRKNYKEMILFSREQDIKIERYRECIEIPRIHRDRSLERKRY